MIAFATFIVVADDTLACPTEVQGILQTVRALSGCRGQAPYLDLDNRSIRQDGPSMFEERSSHRHMSKITYVMLAINLGVESSLFKPVPTFYE